MKIITNMNERNRNERKDRRKFFRLPFGDGRAYHDIWESKDYKRIKDNNLLPLLTDELVFPLEGGNGEETYATLADGTSYHAVERSFTYDGKRRWIITVSFNGKVVREIKPVLPEDFYK